MKYHHGDLKHALLTAGIEKLNQGNSISLRELATDVGVTPSAVYRHFANKNELMIALAEEGFTLLANKFNTLEEDEPIQRLLALGEAYVQFAQSHPVHYKIMFGDKTWQNDNDQLPPQLQTSCQSTFMDLDQVCEALTKHRPEMKTLFIATFWSQVHGFALLSIQGQLDLLPNAIHIRDVLDLTWLNMVNTLN